MFLPSVAERHRRAVLLSVGLAALLLQAIVRVPLLEGAARALVSPLAAIHMPLSAWLVDRVLPAPAPAADSSLQADALLRAERRAGLPKSVAGVQWLEVPVGRLNAESGHLLLAAGADFGLAPGMPVVFGDRWIGRVGVTGPQTAEVEICSGAARTTPAILVGDRGLPLRAVLEGRGAGTRPLVRWLDPQAEPVAGTPVRFRRGADDPPPYAQLDLAIGELVNVGDAERGSQAWEVDFSLPPGAEGRVYVAAGAVAESVVAEPPVQSTQAQLALRADGVFGTRLCGLQVLGEVPATAALVQGRVLGLIVAQRGTIYWCNRRAPAAWRASEWIGLSAGGELGAAELRFTRGGGGVPRGLFLGSETDAAPAPLAQGLAVIGRLPLADPED